jgi:3'(2'), 5'-bisphosphate nucleotidase
MNISYQTLHNGNKYLWIDTQVLIKNFCKISKKDYDIKVSSEKFTRYLQDENVDEIWPELSKYNREFIKTGFTPKEQVAGLGNKGTVWNEDVMKNKYWLLDNALRSILDASDFMMSVYNSSSQFDVTYKSEHQPLTIADKGAHNHITGHLRANTPYFVLSEECSDKYKLQITEHESFWLIDPLDGTKEFIKRNGEFAILISFIHKGEPIVGVMYFPVKDVVYYATNDVNYAFKIEKFKETTKIHGFNFALGNRTTVRIDKGQRHELILLTSRSHREPEMDDYIKSIIKKGYNVIEQGFGSSVKFEKMLNNEADIYARVVNKGRGPSQWDIAAAHCIIKAAGGEVLNLETRKELTYGGAELKLPSFIIKHPNLNV